jgi:hypothetical protein
MQWFHGGQQRGALEGNEYKSLQPVLTKQRISISKAHIYNRKKKKTLHLPVSIVRTATTTASDRLVISLIKSTHPSKDKSKVQTHTSILLSLLPSQALPDLIVQLYTRVHLDHLNVVGDYWTNKLEHRCECQECAAKIVE